MAINWKVLVPVMAVLLANCTREAPRDSEPPRTGGAPRDSATPRDTAPATRKWEVTPTSAGPLRVGMHADSALVALGKPVATAKRSACDYLAVDAPVMVMVEHDTVVRFDVVKGAIATTEGARIGDPIARIQELYPRVRVQPHKYTNGKYLIVSSGNDTTHQLIFETDTARVVRYRAGRLPAVAYVEGCG